jgi:phosphatidylserine/phosphatidylglycerophosphate/cardiolipin synthase-like enzyme
LLAHPRAGVFALWSADVSSARPGVMELNQIFVHSKVVLVDDQWATVGTANLDGVSLHSYGDDYTGRLARRVFRDVRNFEVNVVIEGEPPDDPTAPARTGSIPELRTRLWSEHLALPVTALGARPAGGWLPLWRESAAGFVAMLRRRARAAPDDGVARRAAHVLPYSSRATPPEQLAELGVPPGAATLELCFNPTWLEAHTSPNWIRNMFL